MNRRLATTPFLFVLLSVCLLAQENNAAQSNSARVPPPSPSAATDQLIEMAETLHAEKNYLDAIDYYRAALKKDNSAMVWNKLGITQLAMGRLEDSRKSFEKSIKLDGQYADAVNNLGVVWYKKNKYSKAIKYYKKALTIRDASAPFHNNLGAAYFSKKEFSRAIAEYQRAFQLDPTVFDRSSKVGVVAQLSSPEDRARYSYLLAKMFAGSGNIDRSLEYLRKALEDGYKEIAAVYKDEEFAGLRKDPRFNELMASKPVAIPQ